MINPNALPQSATLQDFQQFGNDLNSTDYNDTLNAMQYMQSQRQPQPMTSGLNMLPQVTVPMQEGGGMEQAMMQEQMMQQQAPQQPEMSPEMQQEMAQRQEGAQIGVEQLQNLAPEEIQQYESEVAELQEAAKGLAALGREGDNLLVHMNPEELEGLASLGTITYNPITGLPEAFSLRKAFRKLTSIPRGIVKGVKRVASSKAFKTIAPIALAIAAPYALPHLAAAAGMGTVGAAGAAGTGLAGFLGGSSIGAAALTSGLGSLAGNLIAGRKFGDAAKAALITGATAGAMKGLSNYGAGKNVFSGKTPLTDAKYQTYKSQFDKGLVEGPGGGPFQDTIGSLTGDGTNYGKGALSKIEGLTSDNITSAAYPGGTSNVVNEAISQGQIPTPSAYGQALSPDAVSNIGNASSFQPQPISAQPMPSPIKAEPSFLSKTATGLGDARDAVVSGFKDRYGGITSFDKGALMNLGKDVLTADIGQSVVDAGNAQEQAAEDQQLQAAGYSVSYPSGFGGQRVIRDASGVVSNLSAADILARALGGGKMQFAPKTTFENVGSNFAGASPEKIGQTIGSSLGFAKEGGLIELAQGGEFSGMVPGQGGGMEDNVYMPIKEGREQVGTLAVSPSEYVVDSYTMAALGNGNPAEGARVMDNTIKQVRKKAYGSTQQPNEIDGLSVLKPMAQGV